MLKSTANKAFKSDSQRLAVSLRSSIAKRRSHLNAALAYKIKGEINGLLLVGKNSRICVCAKLRRN
ncbi:hypothetical protein BT101_24720 [Vibrio parahaemolyticus]|nr:hypothetical protein BT101_24720 [Vibrio parahaemolyticus]